MEVAQTEPHDGEEPVIDAIRAGDRYALGELMARHNGWVRGVVFAVLGEQDGMEDVTQQVWINVWQRISELKDTGRWRTWVYRLARNAAIDAGREITRRRQRTGRAAGTVDEPGLSPSPDTALEKDERKRNILAAIQALPVLYREPFVLRHLNDWSYREIATVMALPVDTVETRLVRARRLLRDALKEL